MYSVDLVNGWGNSSLRAVRHGVSACAFKFQAAWDLGSFVKILEDPYSLGAHQMQVLRLQEAWDVEIFRRERQDNFWVGDLEFTCTAGASKRMWVVGSMNYFIGLSAPPSLKL
jgi:hypothetical protein